MNASRYAPKPISGWPTFVLKIVVLAVAFGCAKFGAWVLLSLIPLGWSAYALNWISLRRQMVDTGRVTLGWSGMLFHCRAPQGLWVFGERGFAVLVCKTPEIETVRRLFPEARVAESIDPFQMPVL